MNQQQMRERIEFEDLLCLESTTQCDPQRLARLLMRHARTYHRLDEMECNGCGTFYNESNESFQRRQEAHEKWLEKRQGQIEKRIAAICAELGDGFKPILGGDPRGCVVKIQVPSGKTNDWGKEGICVPISL